jgi:ketosteroid isomerase-like protein
MDPEVEILRRGYDAFSRRDVEALVALCDPEIRLTPYIARLEGSSYEGHDGLRRYTQDAWSALDAFVMELESVRCCVPGDWYLARGCFRLRGRESDPPVTSTWAQLVKFRDGKMLEWRTYATEEEALEALSLEARS